MAKKRDRKIIKEGVIGEPGKKKTLCPEPFATATIIPSMFASDFSTATARDASGATMVCSWKVARLLSTATELANDASTACARVISPNMLLLRVPVTRVGRKKEIK